MRKGGRVRCVYMWEYCRGAAMVGVIDLPALVGHWVMDMMGMAGRCRYPMNVIYLL